MSRVWSNIHKIRKRQADDPDVLLALMTDTAPLVGEAFFKTLVKHLAETYNAPYAIVTELVDTDELTVHVHAIWKNGDHGDQFDYSARGTPCACVFENGLSYFPDRLQQLFPEDKDLVAMGVNSYLGMPLTTHDGKAIGHICVLSPIPLEETDNAQKYLEMFSSRASTELQRLQLERELLRHQVYLTQLVEERTAELKLAKEQAERASQAKSDFLARMSHELKTPMHAILGFAQLLKEDFNGSLVPEQKNFIENILTSGWYLETLITTILDLSLLETEVISTNIRPCNIKAIIDDSIAIVTPLLVEKNVSIQYDHDAQTDAQIQVDHARFMQVMINLLSNAIKFNNIDGQVYIDIQKHGHNLVRITVRDTGCGISKQDQERIFEKFERLDAEKKQIDGMGLGLAITKKIVDHMNGFIAVESQAAYGASFYVDFPIAT